MIASAPALAQSQLPHEMLREVRDEISSTTPYTAPLAPPISLPDAPAPQRVKDNVSVIDKKFIAVLPTLGVAAPLRPTPPNPPPPHPPPPPPPPPPPVPPNHRLVARYAAIY